MEMPALWTNEMFARAGQKSAVSPGDRVGAPQTGFLVSPLALQGQLRSKCIAAGPARTSTGRHELVKKSCGIWKARA